MPNGKLEGRIKFDSTIAVDFTDDGGGYTATIPVGNWYLSSAGSTANDFLAEMKTQFESVNGAVVWTFSIAAGEGGAGKVTVSNDGTACAIAWDSDSQPIRDLLGFTADVSSNGQTGADQCQALWLPSCPPSGMVNGTDSAGRIISDMRTVSSASGYAYSRGGRYHYRNQLRYQAITRAKTWVGSETTNNASFEQFWLDCILGKETYSRPGGPIRWYPDADTDGTYYEYHVADFREFGPSMVEDEWTGLFGIEVPNLIKVPS